ncbi:hypothetical protein [Halopenitus persicus]|uniref:Uncharacterized protein n=1 Tax=Halopenitus persicus TaxID=1048396 RepID=A0A1H3MNS5_9EURY|nr:hypothetical protein [Halopenitus persicus]SDY78236.1 hypothetical protein SAMN05216564_11022 [Halopenitus persicus]
MVETDSNGTHTRDPNRAVLRELASLLASEDWIDEISVFPATPPESIVITLEATHYPPDRVAEAYVEVQSYTNGDFHVSYVEDHHGTEWCCRWDRHRSEEYTRDHFHAPPSATHDAGSNREYPADLLTTVANVVVPWIYDRIGNVWDEVD